MTPVAGSRGGRDPVPNACDISVTAFRGFDSMDAGAVHDRRVVGAWIRRVEYTRLGRRTAGAVGSSSERELKINKEHWI